MECNAFSVIRMQQPCRGERGIEKSLFAMQRSKNLDRESRIEYLKLIRSIMFILSKFLEHIPNFQEQPRAIQVVSPGVFELPGEKKMPPPHSVSAKTVRLVAAV